MVSEFWLVPQMGCGRGADVAGALGPALGSAWTHRGTLCLSGLSLPTWELRRYSYPVIKLWSLFLTSGDYWV
jgi:hypothetical protein